ncbi:MAG: complex I NDUFA9 subunit family protein, partial [Alphaproteobacteria bacterium]|nr:complex I NDUFA9 subunit family protein [Alphaproteobacteria bacterium]
TYEFGGGQVYSFRELMEMVCAQTGRQRFLVPVPFALVKFDAAFLQLWPRPLLTMDQVELLKRDNVADGNCPGLDDLGIAPTPLEAVLPTYMHRYRRAGRLQPTEQA